MNEKVRFELKDLVTVWSGIGNREKVNGDEILICQHTPETDQYTDILTGTKYPLNTFDSCHFGKTVVFKPYPLVFRIEDNNLKNHILEQGFITKKEAIALYHYLNNYEITSKTLPEHTTLLNQKEFIKEPGLYREDELTQLMISLALNKKITVLFGPNGVGKTAIVDQLAYLSQNNLLPEFLQDKKLIELNISALTNPKEQLNTIIKYIKDQKAILIIDSVNNIDINLLNILFYEAERQNIKIIITTTSNNYNDNFNKFDPIEIKELDKESIIEISKLEFEHQSKEKNVSYNQTYIDEIINILLECTLLENNHMVNLNTISNPGFILSIIEESFAIAQIKNVNILNIEHILQALEKNKKISRGQKNKAKQQLEELKPKKNKIFIKK